MNGAHGGDLTRSSFRADRHYSGVRMQQGRVQLDADWNEQLDVTAHRDRAEALDLIGVAGVPKVDGGFEVTPSPDGTDLLISAGRAWVAGHLCEADGSTTAVADAPTAAQVKVDSLVLDGTEIAPGSWVEVLSDTDSVVARVTAVDVAANTVTFNGSITTLTGDLRLRRRYSYAVQPDLPLPEHTSQASATDPRVLDLPVGTYLAYLDVWERSITALDDPVISEPALGVDTATRTKVIWQLRLLDLANVPDPKDCKTNLSAALTALAPSTGLMAAQAQPPAGSADLCKPTPAGGYVGLENQLYRVHVHDLAADRPVILWSRENASVATTWVASIATDILQVASIGKDAVLGFKPGDWVELFDDTCVLDARPGTLVRLLDAREDRLTLEVGTATGSTDIGQFPRNPQVRRWDSPGPLTVTGDDWVDLEYGVQVRFPKGGTYRRHDYWLVPARAVTADVEWPRDSGGEPLAQTAAGILHDTGRLAIVTRTDGGLTVADCRDLFPALTALTAADVTVTNEACQMPGVETVQDAIDALCKSNDLRRHNRLLHGYGIVCGLAVHCGPDGTDVVIDQPKIAVDQPIAVDKLAPAMVLPTADRRELFREGKFEAAAPRRFVTVEPGAAIDADGYDLDVPEAVVVDVLREIKELGTDVLDENGDGEVSLVLRSDPERGPIVAAVRYVATTGRQWLNGTLIKDIYEDCIAKLFQWVKAQLDPGPDKNPRAYLLRTALTNLLTYVANPQSGGKLFVAANEHDVLVNFYEGLKKRLRSETFCAMFDDARPYPDYPESLQGIRTIAGTGWHSRARIHPSGDEVWTTGGGMNPLRTGTMINRYSLTEERLLARIDPVSGLELAQGAKSSTTAAAVTDVAFSPDGKLIYVAVPTRDGNDTLFRVGEISSGGVKWRPATTICGVKLATLVTTQADPDAVYAVGLRRVSAQDKAVSWREYTGAGIWRIPAKEVPDGLGPLDSTAGLNTVGHLVISPRGDAVFTVGPDGGTAERYERLVSMRLPDQSDRRDLPLDGSGADDLALVLRSDAFKGPAAWVMVGSGADRELAGFDLATGEQRARVAAGGSGRISLQAVNDRILLADSNTSLARVFDTARLEFVEGLLLPVQAGPVSTTATMVEPRRAIVLNQVSNSLSVIDVELVMADRFDTEVLLAYRHAAVEAFADLLGGLAQYLKDCLCDHFLVNCPPRQENKDLDLAAVSIRGGSVYKVCNFSRRRYVKSFPTVGYWLSLVPVLPALREALEVFCCWVLPDYFGKYSAVGRAEQGDRVDAAKMLRFLQMVQEEDLTSRFHSLNFGSLFSFLRGANTGNWTAPPPPPTPPQGPTGGGSVVAPPIVTEPSTHELILRNMLRNPVIRHDLATVRDEPLSQDVRVAPMLPPTGMQAAAEPSGTQATPSPDLEKLMARVATLEKKLASLSKPAAQTRRTPTKRKPADG